MTRVPDWSEQEFEDRSNALAGLIRRAWRAVARLIAGQLESKPIVTAADAGGIPDAWQVETEAQLLGYLTDTYLDAAGKVRQTLDAPDDFLLTDDLVSAYLRSARNRLRGIGDDVWQEVSAQLIQGVSAGESIPELAARVRSTTGVSDARSLTIARTEVHAAHEAGSFDQALFVDPDATKVWLATEDVRTRDTHRAADGQRRKLREPFEVGGGQLRYPGDPLGPADEVINCRCTTVYDFGTLDSVTSDDPELALVAASKKKWTPSKHPRGSDGKFIKKGAVTDLLSKPKPELLTVSTAIEELTEKSWGQLTDAQQDYIMDSYGKLPKGSFLEKHAAEKLSQIGALGGSNKPSSPLKATDVGHIDKKDALELYKQLVHPTQGKGITLSDPPEKIYQAAVEVAETNAGKKSKYGPNLTAEDVITITDISKAANVSINATNKHLFLKKVNAWIEEKDSSAPAIDQTPAVETPTVPKAKVLAQAAPLTNKAAKTILEADDFAQLGKQKYKKPLGKTGKPLRVGFLGDDGSITAHVGLKPGDPTKVSTFLIWGKYPPGTTILEGEAGKSSVVWNGKKYEFREEGQTTQVLGKQDAYDKLHSQEGWVVPKYEDQPVDQPGVLTELVEGYEPDDDEGDTDLPSPPEPTPTPEPEPAVAEVLPVPESEPEPEPEPVAVPEPEPVPAGLSDEVDFSGYTKVGGQAGSNQGGVFEAPDGTREYVKKAKSEQHASNEVAASAFYNLAGIGTPQVRKGTGAPGIGGGLQTGTKLVPGAKSDLKSKMKDPAYKKEIQAGFVVDAWLANWDVAGLVYDNIVTGEDGKPHRIDVGGALLFRAQGAPKGGAFGPTVTELETLRNPSMNQQSASLFGDMSDAEIAAAAERVTSITNEQIDSIVKESGLPSKVAQTLKDRRDYIADKYPPAPAPAVVPEPELMPEAEPDVLEQLLQGTYDDQVTGLLNKLKNGDQQLSNAESVDLAKGMIQDEWNGLTASQRSKLALGVDAALDDPSVDNQDAWLAFNRITDFQSSQTAPVPTPSPAMTIPTPEPDVDEAAELSGDEAWAGLFDDWAYPPTPTVIAESSNGNHRVIAQPNNTFTLEWQTGDSWIDVEDFDPNVSEESFSELAESHASGWHVVTPHSAMPAPAPAPALAAPTTFVTPALTLPDTTWTLSAGKSKDEIEAYTSFNHPAGTILGITSDANMQVVSTGDGSYVLQMLDADNNWFDGAALSGGTLASMLNENTWTLPDSTFDAAMPTPDVPSPATPEPTGSGADTSGISTSYKKSWKKKLSAAKVGYYSKPEKIWDQIKEIQAQHPDPLNPGQSKYTPLQIIKSLDDVYTGKKEQNPYETKMVAWAATAKGKAYTGNTGTSQATTPNTPAATQTVPSPGPQPMPWTKETTAKLFDAVPDLDLGAVVATNTDTKGIQYQIVVSEDAGVKTLQMQYKPIGETTWLPSIFMPSKQGFVNATDIDFGAGPWKSAVVQLPSGGVAPAPDLTPAGFSSKITELAPTEQNAELIWNKLDSLPDGMVIAYNPGGTSNEYRMVVATDPMGLKFVKFERKSKKAPGADWETSTLTSDSLGAFQDDVTTLLGGNSWQLFDPQPDATTTPSTPPAPAGPPMPKQFNATVKAIYAAMPTYQVGKPVAIAEFNGEKYALVPGYGTTKKGYKSTKKKLILKKESSYSGYWATVEPIETQVKLAQILKDPKYAWMEPLETPAVAPPSVSVPVQSTKPTVSVGSFQKTPEDIGNLWDSLNEIGSGMILADGTPNGVPTKIMSKIGSDGSIKVEAHTQTTSAVIATSKQDLVNLLTGNETWTITASKSPLFGAGEIANLSPEKQQGLYDDFKKQPATYLKSPAQDIYAALSSIASDNGLTLLQMLRVVDAIGAKKVSKPDEHLFEKKIKDWLKTPQGAAVASGKPIPLPAGPALSPGVSLGAMEPFEETGKYSYSTISTTEATKLGNEFKKASPAGEWTPAQHDGLQAYTGGIYYSINQYYYGKIPSISATNEKAAKNAQLGMRLSTVPMLLHRGTGFDGVGGANSHADLEKKVGQTFFSGGFFSTSVGGKEAFSGKSVTLEIEAPPGTPMAYLKNISLHKGENEMLLAAGLSYKIISVKKVGSKSVVRVRVVPPVGPFPWELSQEG